MIGGTRANDLDHLQVNCAYIIRVLNSQLLVKISVKIIIYTLVDFVKFKVWCLFI